MIYSDDGEVEVLDSVARLSFLGSGLDEYRIA